MTDARTTTAALGGRWLRHYGRARCPVCHGGERGNYPLSIADGASGALLLHCFKGCTFNEIIGALRGLGILDGKGRYRAPTPEDMARLRAERQAEADKRAAQADACWRESRPTEGTLAETYLRNRGITCVLPETLRFQPACWHASAKRFPALIARVDGCERFAIHRTYLRPDGTGKAEVEPAKAMLGPTGGGAVRLTDGPEPLVVCEGVETGLSLASGLLRRPAEVWAALSTRGMRGLRLPPSPGRLTIATDGDDPGRAAGHDLAERAHALGWAVSILDPGDGADFNDVLVGKAVAA